MNIKSLNEGTLTLKKKLEIQEEARLAKQQQEQELERKQKLKMLEEQKQCEAEEAEKHATEQREQLAKEKLEKEQQETLKNEKKIEEEKIVLPLIFSQTKEQQKQALLQKQFWVAVESGDVLAVNNALKIDADVINNIDPKTKFSALQFAIIKDKKEVCSALLNAKKIDLNYSGGLLKKNALELAKFMKRTEMVEWIENASKKKTSIHI